MPKVLLTNHHLLNYAGSELVTLDIAREFQQKGWNVSVATFVLGGDIENRFNQSGIEVVNVLQKSLSETEFDLVWSHHFPVLIKCLVEDSVKTKALIISSLSPYEPLEAIPFFHSKSDLILCNSEETKKEIIESNINLNVNKLFVFKNSVPSDWFKINLHKDDSELRKIAIISNHPPTEIIDIIDILKSQKINVDLIGISGTSKLVNIDLLSSYDAVITIGRTVQHCMALGIPVFCYDHFGGPGWLTPDNFQRAEWFNYSGRCCYKRFTSEQSVEIVKDLINGYIESKQHLSFFRNYAIENYSLTKNIDVVLTRINNTNRINKDYIDFKSEQVIEKVGKVYRRIFSEREILNQDLERSQSQLQQTQSELERSQSQLQQTQSELERSQSQLQQTQSELERSQSQLQQTQSELVESQSQLQQTQSELERSQNTITAMESTKFWKLRKIWFKVKTLPSIRSFIFQNLAKLKLIFILIFTNGLRHTINLLKQEDKIPLSDDFNYQRWLIKNYPRKIDLISMTENINNLKYKPVISIIMPVYNTPEEFLKEAIDSVLNQVYPYWELCIADDASTKQYIQILLTEYINKDNRIKVVFREKNGHISLSSNSAIDLARGEYIALLDHDDLLTPHALYEVVKLLNQYPEADMIYSDEDKINEEVKLQDPYFKPDWCPDSFLSRMYTRHLGVYRRELVKQIGGFRGGYEGSQDYDLVLRLTEKTDKIFHIPNILYHWRIHSKSTAQDISTKNYATIAAQKAIKDALERRGEMGKVIPIQGRYNHVRYEIKNHDLISIIIPTKNLGDVLNTCLQSIFEKTTYPNYEILVIDNGSTEEKTKQIIELWKIKEPQRFRSEVLNIPFNFSKINNYAVKQTKGKYLLFLNNDTEVINNDWLHAMVEQAQRDSIGAVGALLLYPDNTIQHAGVIAGIGGVANHSHKNYHKEAHGYFNQIKTINNYSAVTAACVMCRREVFEEVGGFEEDLAVAFNDIDLCFKMVNKGYNNVYLPHVKLYHYESKSRGYEDTPEKKARFNNEVKYMQSKWQSLINHDPCYNPNLSKKSEDYTINI